VVSALSAERLVREACAGGKAPSPLSGGRLVALGLGKAAAPMLRGARAAVELTPLAFAVPPEDADPPILVAGSHPVPDEGSVRAGAALLDAARSLGQSDAALLLVSGGGSSLAEVPRPGLSLPDVRAVNEALLRSGAPIEEMNCVRSHLSRLKGGGLARALHAAGVRRARALVLVDVPRGGTAAVSSGPAAADPTTFAEAREILHRRSVDLPRAAWEILERAAEETLKPGEPADFIEHVALCDFTAPAREAARLHPPAEVLPLVTGPVEEVARGYAARPGPGFFCASGEPEARIPVSAPPGGRAQHLALLMAHALRGKRGSFLAGGTDGRDGPTEFAGAAVDGTTWDEAVRRGLDPLRAIESFDATRVLSQLGVTIPRQAALAHAGELHLLSLE
jgi:hydroxypyruvate reductase